VFTQIDPAQPARVFKCAILIEKDKYQGET
jgi:hypothetical protein